jgi:carbon-monoxide dehydrogenase medium subunit
MLGEFEYARVGTVERGCALLREAAGRAAVLAGGTDLLVAIRGGVVSLDLLVDFKGVPEMNALSVSRKEGAVIGASVPLNLLVENRTIREAYPALAEAALSVGTCQIRNRATLAGNLCNASPAADTAPALLVLDAVLTLASTRGTRKLAVEEFFLDVKKSALAPDEVVTRVEIPPVRRGTRTAFLKKQRIRGHDLAILNMAGSYDVESGNLKIAIGSSSRTPILLPSLGEPVEVTASVDHLVARLDAIAQEAVSPISDLRASADYRRAMIPVFLRRLLKALLQPGETATRKEKKGGKG